MRDLVVLLVAELRALRREPGLWSLLLVALGAGYALAFADRLTPDLDALATEQPVDPDPSEAGPLACREAARASVRVEGALPAWARRGRDGFGALEARGEAAVLVRAWPAGDGAAGHAEGAAAGNLDDTPLIEVLPLREHAPVRAVADCLRRRLRAERGRRLDDLGITERPDRVVALAWTADPEPPPLPPAGLGLLGLLAVAAITWSTDVLPRHRRTGWLESLSVTGLSRLVLAATEVAGGWLYGLAVAAVAVAGHAAGMARGGSTPLPAGFALPTVLLALALAAWAVRLHARSRDVRAAAAVAALSTLVLGAVAGLAVLLAHQGHPTWAAAIPIGGLAAGILGELPGRTLILGELSALAATALLLASVTRVLAADDLGATPLGAAAARRARGDWLPEALLLSLLAFAGPMALGGVFRQPSAAVPVHVAGQVLFMALPALVLPRLLALPRAEVVPLGLPPARAWLAAPAVAAGAFAWGSLAQRWIPLGAGIDPEALGDYEAIMRALWGGGGLLAVAVIPGVCEELLFRGAVLGLLRRRVGRWTPAAALLGQALLFGAIHVLAFKLAPTAGTGLLLGLLAWRSGSLLPGMLAHALLNGGVMSLHARDPELAARLVDGLPAPAGLALLALGVAAAWAAGPHPLRSPPA